MTRTPGDSGRGRNDLKVRVKTARGRKLSSTRWLQRQLNDPFVRQAQAEGLRARSAYKLREIDEKYAVLKPGARVVDLGAAPGGWLQIAKKAVGSRGTVLGVDLLEIAALEGVETLVLDFLEEGADETVKAALGGPADVVLSDMAPATTGHRATDHLRIVALCETAAHFAFDVLAPGGAFVAKVFQGGAEGDLLRLLKLRFDTVRHMKPASSRSDSAEMYVIATGFRAP